MRKIVLSCALAWLAQSAASASAASTASTVYAVSTVSATSAAASACPAADKLIDKYGISFSGFERAIAPVNSPGKVPDTAGTRAADLVVIALTGKAVLVNDGYLHHALIDRAVKRAWIHRTGGFIGVDEWYGPVHLPERDLDGCVVERYRQ